MSHHVARCIWQELWLQPYWVLHWAQAGQTTETTDKTEIHAASVLYQPRPEQMHLEIEWRNQTLDCKNLFQFMLLPQKSLRAIMNWNSVWIPLLSLDSAFLIGGGKLTDMIMCSTYTCVSCSVEQPDRRTVDSLAFTDLIWLKMARSTADLESAWSSQSKHKLTWSELILTHWS